MCAVTKLIDLFPKRSIDANIYISTVDIYKFTYLKVSHSGAGAYIRKFKIFDLSRSKKWAGFRRRRLYFLGKKRFSRLGYDLNKHCPARGSKNDRKMVIDV